MLALLDLDSEINAIYPTFAQELELSIRSMDVRVQKINSPLLDTFEIVVLAFSMINKANWGRFFEKTFLVDNISPEVVLGVFLILSDADVDFSIWKL